MKPTDEERIDSDLTRSSSDSEFAQSSVEDSQMVGAVSASQWEMVIKIRAFEELVLDLFSKNKLSGTTHTYIGEEATAVALMQFIKKEDTVFSNHRCHGHFLAYGGPAKALLAEIMSRQSGICEGRGGSQHIHFRNFYTNGIQGGIVPNATGVGLANKISGKTANTVVFLGDGTMGQGVVYESMNLAAICSIPVIYVVEDNQYAMSSRRTDMFAGDIAKRIEGFQIRTFEIESTDVEDLSTFFADVFAYVDKERCPACAVVHNYRLGAHSKGDDTRDADEVNQHRKNDPMLLVQEKLGKETADSIYQKYRAVYEEYVSELEKEETITIVAGENSETQDYAKGKYFMHEKIRCVERLQQTFSELLNENENIVFLGEDICDPYGGAFKATRGLSTDHPDRVLNMPISEAALAGMGVGMAMSGKIPVVEIMFGDFLTLAFDQLLNHATKYGWVYGREVHVPVIVRTPMGGKRGYGATHSQSLEKFLIGIPLLRVLALSPFHDPRELYRELVQVIDSPTVVIENKTMYAERLAEIENNRYGDFSVREVCHHIFPTFCFSLDDQSAPDYCIITYGGMAMDCIQAAEELMLKEEIQADVLVLSSLAPIPIEDLKEILQEPANVVLVEEGTITGGIGAELAAICAEKKLCKDILRIAAMDLPIPNGSVLEKQVLPDAESIARRIRSHYYGC